ncbi:hypothetical protein [Cytobacillus praedii]|uniref:Uncharacterized protein n=1 Tax=Cytobacillus praedii TaxID=1742358 RepID=A0A4R1AT34_9BACI|nr:hypothetical protein [Cytobacillus praedii]TCJ00018.1 hypothetical protein E0Y62_26965 [Cytobacillus praedii]
MDGKIQGEFLSSGFQDGMEFLIFKVEQQQQEIERLNNEIKEIEKVSDYNADLRTKYEKALYEILDCGLDYAATTQEHHSCAEGMYRYAEQALGNTR